MKRTLSIISILLALLILFSACTEPDGINTGSPGMGMVPPVAIRIRGDKTEFDIDNVTLDFSFGSKLGTSNWYEIDDERCPVVCVAVYFFNVKFANHNYFYTPVADYKEIEGWHFVKDITLENFEQNYKVEYRWVGATKFDHTETLTIPKEIFEDVTGYLCFAVYPIVYIPSKNSYKVGDGHKEGLKYEILENGKVRISKPDGGYSDAYYKNEIK